MSCVFRKTECREGDPTDLAFGRGPEGEPSPVSRTCHLRGGKRWLSGLNSWSMFPMATPKL